jgi:serine/threonine protein kinase
MSSPQGHPVPSLEKIALEKGWATTEQIRAAVRFQSERKARGKAVTISQALVALGILTEVQVRRALGLKATPGAPKVSSAVTGLIKGYRIERCLGSGGMGDVYLAQQTSLDRPVALKILPAHLAKDQEFVERFLSEARAAGKVAHENIVAAVDVGESNGRYYFVMELVEGSTLQQAIQKEGPLAEKRALEIARQVARGLKHAHLQGLIHRDIKPANIMFTSGDVAKICDFGLAREIDADVTLTMPGIVQSSPAYASPEQCRGRQDLDHRTDMYSLGVTLFEMLTGQRPFQAETAGALFIKHATEAPPSPQSLNPAITPAASQLVLRLLRKEPTQRFETYDQLIEAIDAVQKSKAAPRPRHASPVPARTALKSRFPWVAAVLGVLLLGAAGGLFLFLREPTKKPAAEPEVRSKSVESDVDRLLKSVALLERRALENPSEFPGVRARWKELVEQFRGTPQLPLLAREQLEFEARVAGKADAEAARVLSEAESHWTLNRPSDALRSVRSFPQGFDGTPAAARVAARGVEWEKAIEERYRAGREKSLALLAATKFEEARAALLPLQAPEYQKSEWKEEIQKLAASIGEAATAQKPAVAGVKEDPQASIALKRDSASGLGLDHLRVLRSAALRADPKERARAAGAFRALAPRSALCRAADVFLSHDDRFWKLGGDRLKLKTDQVELDLEGQAQVEDGKNTVFQATTGHRVVLQKDGKISLNGGSWITPQKAELTRNLPTPLLKVLGEYLAALPLERVDTLSAADHQGQFVGLAKKISELGETPKDLLCLFALAHADDLLAQNLRPDAEGMRLCRLGPAKTVDYWGPPGVVSRLALARLLAAQGPPAEVRRAADAVAGAVDFPSRLLSGLATFREKEFDPSAAAASWKKLAGLGLETSPARFCDEVAERLKRAATCDGCAGQGKYPCKKCAASGIADCDKCKGTGRIKEVDTTGMGYSGMIPCQGCKQKGRITCPVCQGVRVSKCDKCEGKKIKKSIPGSEYQELIGLHCCPSCGGLGSVFSRIGFPCPDCDGLGRFPSR